MFNSKQTNLDSYSMNKKSNNKLTSVNENQPFINAALKNSAKTLSGNGALKYSTTGNPFIDQFNMMGDYKMPRTFDEISKDCEALWNISPIDCVKFTLFLRTITRKVRLWDGTISKEAQKGGELKHEAIFRYIWLFTKNPDIFYMNLNLLVSLGSWNDIFTMLKYDLIYHTWNDRILNWNNMSMFILAGLANTNNCELVKKYMPQIKAHSKNKTVDSQADTIIAKWLCSQIFGGKENSTNYMKYRKLKASGTAHQWQQLISQGKHDQINFDTIHGRALSQLVKGKYLSNHNLKEKYASWIGKTSNTKVKYTGYVHELFHNIHIYRLDNNHLMTVDKQFSTLVNKAKTNALNTKYIVVRDTSDSMTSKAFGTNMSSFNIAKAIALYFSEFLTGPFANSFIEFNNKAKLRVWSGDTPTNKWFNDTCCFNGSTNFQNVFDLFVNLKNSGVNECDFPTGIICISDGQFNSTKELTNTNVDEARKKLRNCGFSKSYVDNFAIILWDIPNSYYGGNTDKKFETYGNANNVYYLSGYCAANISFIMGDNKSTLDLVVNALDQEILNMVKI